MTGCTATGCGRGHYARGLCNTHWKAQRRAAGIDASRSRYAEQRTCDCCGDTYTSDRPESLYCSTTCRDLANLSAGQQAAAGRAGADTNRWKRSTEWACILQYRQCPECDTTWCGKPDRARVYCTRRCALRARNRTHRDRYRRHARAVHTRDGYTCWLCHEPTSPEYRYDDPLAPTLDHVIPRSRGGSDDPDNLRTAHAICNALRGAPALNTIPAL